MMRMYIMSHIQKYREAYPDTYLHIVKILTHTMQVLERMHYLAVPQT